MARRLLHLRAHAAGLSQRCAPRLLPSRPYISDMRRTAFADRLLRSLRFEISSCRAGPAPAPPPSAPFSVDDRPGEQWIRLRRAFNDDKEEEEVRVDATMVDGATAPTRSGEIPEPDAGRQLRLHISLHVEVTKAARPDGAFVFECSAWPDEMEVERVYPVRRGGPAPVQQYMGRQFRSSCHLYVLKFMENWDGSRMCRKLTQLDEDMQSAVHDYLEHRGVNDELAAFLHLYMENKEQTERVRWLKNVEGYIKK